jgi:hypothetical protein
MTTSTDNCIIPQKITAVSVITVLLPVHQYGREATQVSSKEVLQILTPYLKNHLVEQLELKKIKKLNHKILHKINHRHLRIEKLHLVKEENFIYKKVVCAYM